MKTTLLMGLVLLGAEPVRIPQDPDSPSASRGGVGWQDAGDEDPGAKAGKEPGDWATALTDEDLDRREEAYGRLLRGAQRDRELRDRLREWARESGELGWTARLALRELALRDDPFSGWGPRRFDRDSDRDSPFAFPGPGWRGAPLPRAFGSPRDFDPFGWMDDDGWMRDLEQRMQDLFEGTGSIAGSSSSEGFRVESGPDGVKVEIQEEQDGETTTKTYEAGSLEELYELHPELKGKLSFRHVPRSDFRDLLDRFRRGRGFTPPLSGRVPTDELGILMREPGQWSASIEGLDRDTGLYVERVLPGTLADALGVRRGDILISLDGRPLRSGEDVRAALSARDRSDPVDAVVVDARGERRELRWVPPTDEQDLRKL